MLTLVSSKLCHRAFTSLELMSPSGEVLAVDLLLPGSPPISLVNVYFPVGFRRVEKLDSLIASKSRVIVAGDFNAHHVSWGFRTDSRGLELWQWLLENDLSCHNSRAITFLRAGSRSALDLTFSSGNVEVTSWGTLPCGSSSDHFPLEFTVGIPLIRIAVRKQKFINARVYQEA